MSRKARLVIAEDEQIIALGMQIFLGEAGHEVCAIAKTAPEAVKLVDRHRPDIALLDVRLAEGTDGTDAAREIRDCWGTPSILVTGHLDRGQAQAVGALGLLKKPYDPARLLEMIEAAMRWIERGTPDEAAPPGMFPSALPPCRTF